VSAQVAPKLEKGDAIHAGVFVRNLKKTDDVTKRYENDDTESPLYGFKLTGKFWRNANKTGDMSINLRDCVRSDDCSIAIHPNAEDFYHVARFDLAQVNTILPLHPFAAQYDPLIEPPDGPNKCHFVLLPTEGTTQSIFALQSELDKPFPVCRMPDSNADKDAADAAASRYRRMVTILKWVRNREGSLS